MDIRAENKISFGDQTFLEDILDNYKAYLTEKTAYHAGYPYNLNFSYQEVLPFFNFLINNLGDPFTPSNYQIDSRYFEQKSLAFFAKL